ncbi:MAG: transcription termination/antitermination protein NusA [Bacilli bacterium]|nr:transcription termination/antitermination protein NusA [Bacilli bacterium]MBP3635470.1 transcription termination/antitermination protein NusA [Bacilli bacterium]
MNGAEFLRAAKELAEVRGITLDEIFTDIETGLNAAYKRNYGGATNSKVKLNPDTGEIKVVSYKIVVDEINMEDDEDAQVLLEELENPADYKVGDVIEEEVTPKDFGRVAASACKQVFTQKVREAERESIMKEFEGAERELLVGTLSREDKQNYYVDLGRAHGILPKSEIIPGEDLTMGSQVKVYVVKIELGQKGGPVILLSRSHYGFVKRLLEKEIPELNEGIVMLYSVARDAGNRSKIAVYSENEKVDAVGACIGEKGIRINNISKELNGEKIDVVRYDKDLVTFIKNALSPAKDVEVYILDPKENKALAVADGDNLSLAIGKKGQNVKLAARLTKCKIDVKTSSQVQEEGINIYKYYEA